MEAWEKELDKIFCNRIKISVEELENIRTKFLFGKEIGLPAREGVLLYLDITEMLNEPLPEEEVANGAFETCEKIKALVEKIVVSKSLV